MKDIRVAAASIGSRWAAIDRNLAGIRRAAEWAASQGARLLLLPECCLTGADWPTAARTPAVERVAVELDSSPMAEVAAIARRTRLVLAVGLYERLAGRVHVTQALVGPRGLLGAYRKVHEGARSSRDRTLFPVFDLGFARVGVSICYDNMFPESARILALRGAEVVLSPFTSLPLGRWAWREQRLVALRARAQDNRVFVVSASEAMPHVAGRPRQWGYSGICCAVDPLGVVLGESNGRVGLPQRLIVNLPAARLRTYFLADVPAIRARRPAAYRALSDEKLQRRWLAAASPFEYNDRTDEMTVRPGRNR